MTKFYSYESILSYFLSCIMYNSCFCISRFL